MHGNLIHYSISSEIPFRVRVLETRLGDESQIKLNVILVLVVFYCLLPPFSVQHNNN